MKKNMLITVALLAAAIAAVLPSCSGWEDGINNNEPEKPESKTCIVFDNTQGICTASVYYDHLRKDKIAEIRAGQLSDKITWMPGDATFYFSYAVSLKESNGLILDYVPKTGKNQKTERIDADTTAKIVIPRLDETLSSQDQLFSDRSYLLIQNNTSFSLQLHRGSSIISPDNSPSSPVVNTGERAQYTIDPGPASIYRLLIGADYRDFSGFIGNFEAGYIYGFAFDGNVSLISEIAAKLENVAKPATVPQAPSAATVLASDGFFTLHWTAAEGAENYEVYFGTAQTPPSVPVKTVPGTATVITGLTNKTAYYVWIKAINQAGSSSFSPASRGIPWPANEVPAVPQTPVIIPGVNQLTVHWNECGGASSYEVYINTSVVRPPLPEMTTDRTNVIIENLENGKIYYLWIRASNNAGRSGYSPFEAGTPQIPAIAPAIPNRPEITAGSRKLTVSWQAVNLAAAYEVWFGTSDDANLSQKFAPDISGGKTEAIITGLVNETTYYVWIKAKNNTGTSGFSLPASGKPSAFAALPDSPAMPTVIPGSRTLDIIWLPVEGALSYEVWSSESSNPESSAKRGADIFGTTVTLNNLDNTTTYYVWIKAKNNIGASGFSPMASGTPSAFAALPHEPQIMPTVTAGSGQLSINWQPVDGATVYEVWTGTSANNLTAAKHGDDVSGLSAVIGGLTNGTTYYIWIKAKNSVGTSGFSPVASGTPQVYAVPPQAPAAPIAGIGSGQININWTATEWAAAYEVWLNTENNSSSAQKHGADISESLSAAIGGLSNGTTYYVWIKAKNGYGISGFSPAASGKPIAAAAAPSLAAENAGITVKWAAMPGADQYEIFCGTGINPPQTAMQTLNAPATTAAITGLVNGTSYNVWIRGKNSTGTGAMYGPASAKPIGNMGTVTVSTGKSGQLVLGWAAVAGADYYEVYHSASDTMPGSPSQTVSATTAAVSDLANGTAYNVWVKAKNDSGSSTSAMATGTPMATPGHLTVGTSNQQVTLAWVAVPGAISYEIYYSIIPTMPVSPAYTVTQPTGAITGLINGTTYNFWVKAVNANGNSDASPMASGKPIGNMGIVTLTSGNGQLVLNWAAVAGADHYEVYHSASGTIPSSPSQTVSATTAAISSLSNGTVYNVWVKAKNDSGSSTSTVVSGKPLGTPGMPTLTPCYRQLSVSWAAVAGADEYEVYYGIGSPSLLATTVTGTTTTISELTSGTTYHVRLKAKNPNGVSEYGPSVSCETSNALSPGLYRNGNKIGTQNLISALTYISTNAVNNDDYTIVLGGNESIAPSTLGYSGKKVGITLQGYVSERTVTLSSNGSMFTVNAGVTLTLDENVSLVGRSTNSASLVKVDASGVLVMNNGAKISGNSSSSNGAGVFIDGKFTMNGGIISGNTRRRSTVWNDFPNGGGVFVDNGCMDMYGGTIKENCAQSSPASASFPRGSSGGGGVCITYGTLTMYDGLICENNAINGGGICTSGVLMMYGGIINKNGYNFSTLTESGGGIYNSGIFIMYDGIVKQNRADYGGGICDRNYSTTSKSFTMHGGVVNGNVASLYGGGVYSIGKITKINIGNNTRDSGIIYGYEVVGNDVDGVLLKNTVNQDGYGDAVFTNSTYGYRKTTAWQTDYIDNATGKGLSVTGNPPFGQ